MAQNITIAGATFNSVPSIVIPTANNGSAIFVDPSPTTATDSDVASGKIYFKSDGSQSTGTASGGGGGGGLTSVVRGTFEYTDAGWNTISLSYSGSGYPIAAIVLVKGGHDGSFASEIRRYAFSDYVVVLANSSSSPAYDKTANVILYYEYKNSTSDGTIYATSTTTTTEIFSTNESATNSAINAFRISGQKEIKVRMVAKSVSTSRYGFLTNTEYTYVVIYSS